MFDVAIGKAGRRLAEAGLALAVAISLPGCGTSLMDNIWGDNAASSSSTVASTSSSALGNSIAPDLGAAGDNDAVASLYNTGLDRLKSSEWSSAVKKFADVERQYPYSSWATKAIIMQAYGNYQAGNFDDSINAANRFITLHPGHRDAPYAYYLIALSDYNRISDSKRDQTQTQKALDDLQEVERRYPGTPYADDVAKKILMAKDHLAGKEMEVGRYYYKRGAYLAGINRFKRVVTDYQNTDQTPEALYRLTEGYVALGVNSEAQTAAAVLGHNYPNSEWYKDAYGLVSSSGQAPVENQESWISKAFKAINPL